MASTVNKTLSIRLVAILLVAVAAGCRPAAQEGPSIEQLRLRHEREQAKLNELVSLKKDLEANHLASVRSLSRADEAKERIDRSIAYRRETLTSIGEDPDEPLSPKLQAELEAQLKAIEQARADNSAKLEELTKQHFEKLKDMNDTILQQRVRVEQAKAALYDAAD